MLGRTPLCLLLTAALAHGAAAQSTTLTVDSRRIGSSAPHFHDLALAISAAAPGDRILVFQCHTNRTYTVSKGLDIEFLRPLPMNPTRSVTNLRIVGVPANQATAIRGLDPGFYANLLYFDVQDCAGPVLVDGGDVNVNITNSQHVHIRDIRFTFQATDSNVTAINCRGLKWLRFTRSRVWLVDCRLTSGGWILPPPVDVELTDSHLRMTGDTQFRASHYDPTQIWPVIVGTGSVTRSPEVALTPQGNTPPVVGPNDVIQPLPSLRSDGGAIGGSIQIAHSGEAGDIYLLVLGLAARPNPVAAHGGFAWLSPPIVQGFGIFDSNGDAGHIDAVPANPFLVGLPITYQSLTAPGGNLQASNPSLLLLR